MVDVEASVVMEPRGRDEKIQLDGSGVYTVIALVLNSGRTCGMIASQFYLRRTSMSGGERG
jgi:hypothetical protein